ncbi:MAG TPA: AbrB/MazE/SpoVT family DNA-binding domain-containing protein [Candidatus Omnitrophota bacterium]|nr:AbrB/MazE/SpoVT family DNA-binding domain-containing protein [Candidatus Omnitrophota bacterium]
MKAALVPIGNSQGVRIPKAILDQCGLRDEVEMTVEGEALVIRPFKPKKKLSDLLAAFDPGKHRHGADERPWDDAPAGSETL